MDVESGFDGGGTFTETENVSWCGRMKEAMMGVVIGFLLFFGGGGVLVWNEGRAVRRAQDLDEGRDAVISLASATNLTAIENSRGQLIYVSDTLQTTEALEDPIFGVTTGSDGNETGSGALKLSRAVQMFQWKETSQTRTVKTSGGGEKRETTYSYSRVWSPTLINSGTFKNQQGHQNPTAFRFEPLTLTSDSITLGSFALSDDVAARINWFTQVTDLDPNDITDESVRNNVTTYNYGYFSGSGSQNDPNIGDSLVEFEQVLPDTISLVGLSSTTSTSIGEFPTSRGGTILLIKRGQFTAAELFQQAIDENEQLTWILRFVGWLAMFIGIMLILKPLSTSLDIIPFVGGCLEGGLNSCVFPLVAAIISIPTAGICIAIGWLVYRPVVAAPLFIAFVGIIACICIRARKKENETQPGKLDNQNDLALSSNQGNYNGGNYSGGNYSSTEKPDTAETGESDVYVSNSAYQPQVGVPVASATPVQTGGVYVPGAQASAPQPFSQSLG